MTAIRACLSLGGYKRKPKGNEIAQISNTIARQQATLCDAKDEKLFAQAVGIIGCTFCPATFKDGKRCKENFEQQQLFALDFDNAKPNEITTFEDILERADQYALPIFFAYETFSSTNGDKFRVVFKNDVSITDIRVAESMQLALGNIFPEADSSCVKDVSKMYFGGNKTKLLYYDEASPEINIETVFRNLTHYCKEKYGDRHYKEKLARVSKNTGIALNNHGLLDVTIIDNPTEKVSGAPAYQHVQNGGTSPDAIVYIKGRGENPPFWCYRINFACADDGTKPSSVGKTVSKKDASNHNAYRSNVLKEITKCRLCCEFYGGTRRLSHEERFGIMTNLINIESGDKDFMRIIDKHYNEQSDKWSKDIKYSIQQKYKPFSCEGFCPYREECEHGSNILSTIHLKRGQIEQVENYHPEYHSLEDTQDDTYNAIYRAFRAEDKQIHVIKAQCSIGKSTTYLNIMKDNPDKRFLIAAPTNLLKRELCEKADGMGISVCMTPSLHSIINKLPSSVSRDIQRLYDCGQYKKVHTYILKKLQDGDIPYLRQYIEERAKLGEFKGSIITTHRYLLTMDNERLDEFDTIIIDEDIILKSVISNQGEITKAQLKELLEATSNEQLKDKIESLLQSSQNQSIIRANGFEWYDEDDEYVDFKFDIPSFCAAEHFCFRKASDEPNLKNDTFSYIKPSSLSERKYIIVSATADKKICNQFFGEDKVDFYECRRSCYKGKLLQYPQKSMSRSCLSSNTKMVERLMKHFGMEESHVITFMRENIGELHFGNTEGSNTLEGEDILVVGTPYYVDFMYKLAAFYLGFEFDPKENQMAHVISHNGYRLHFTTYANENLRAIQFWMLESELEQAVGRARLLRNDCVVHLFSNFPMCQAEMVNAFDFKSVDDVDG